MSMNDPNEYCKYSEISGQFLREILPEIEELLITWDEEYVLDVGCATGQNTSEILAPFHPTATIVGVDISEEMIEFARKTHTTSKLSFRVLDITDRNNPWISEHCGKFTKVYSPFTMHRVLDQRRAYENMFNLLKLEGELITITPVTDCLDTVLPYLTKIPKYSQYSDQLSKMRVFINPTDDYKSLSLDLLKAVGFEVKLTEEKELSFCAPSIDYVVGFYGQVSYLSRILPSDLFQDALVDVKNIIEENNLVEQVQGGYLQKYTILTIIAKKPLQ